MTKYFWTDNYNSSYKETRKHTSSYPFGIVFLVYIFIYVFVCLTYYTGGLSNLFSMLLNGLIFYCVNDNNIEFINKILIYLIAAFLWFMFLLLKSLIKAIIGWVSDLFNRDDSYINKELNNLGYFEIEKNNFLGFLLFLISEVLIFGGLFWTLFFNMCAPMVQIGHLWPPIGIPFISAEKIPLLNTLLLVSSGITITVAHKLIVKYVTFVSKTNVSKKIK